MINFTIILISFILAIDCFVVSVCINSVLKLSKKEYFRIPIHFGLFQGGMVILGFYLGLSFLSLIENYDHWVASALLFFVGVRMIYHSLKKEKAINEISYKTIILLSIATSIDALAIGGAFSIINGAIMVDALIITFFSFIFSLFGLFLGQRLKNFKLYYFGILGGFVLIGLGAKILFEHLV